MKEQGIFPKHQVLDNKISALYQNEIKATNMTFQFVPPDNHQRNIAKTFIQTWKHHFIGVLSGTVASFPEHLWCQVIPQAEHQLLLLRQYIINPKMCTFARLYGQHNYDATPFFLIGMETIVQYKPKLQRTFAEHCIKGFVIGT